MHIRDDDDFLEQLDFAKQALGFKSRTKTLNRLVTVSAVLLGIPTDTTEIRKTLEFISSIDPIRAEALFEVFHLGQEIETTLAVIGNSK